MGSISSRIKNLVLLIAFVVVGPFSQAQEKPPGLEYLEVQAARLTQDIASLKKRVESPAVTGWEKKADLDLIDIKSQTLARVNAATEGFLKQPTAFTQADGQLDQLDRVSLVNYLDGLEYLTKDNKHREKWLTDHWPIPRPKEDSKLSSIENMSKNWDPSYKKSFKAFGLTLERHKLETFDFQSKSKSKSARTYDCNSDYRKRLSPDLLPDKRKNTPYGIQGMIEKCGFDPEHPWRTGELNCINNIDMNQYDCIKTGNNICATSPAAFLKSLDIERSEKSVQSFDLRLKTYRAPELQGTTHACVAFALANELHYQMDRTLLFAELSPSLNSFQVYNQLSNPSAGPCKSSNEKNEVERATANASGLYANKTMALMPSEPICLPGETGAVLASKPVSVSAKDVDFNFFYSLVKAGQGAMVSIATEVAIENEDWVKYGCRQSAHMIYVVGVGRGPTPYGGGMGEYVVVRDSFRGQPREYKVAFHDLKKVMDGVYKLDQLSYIPPRLKPNRSTPSEGTRPNPEAVD